MNKIQKRRLIYVVFLLSGITIAASLIFYALNQNMNVFVTPSQIAERHIVKHYNLRLGGMVKKASIVRDTHDLNVSFIVTDFKREIKVQYNGVLPDLFHEEKGVIVEGNINEQGIFIASRVLAKHDENYMPKNVYESMRQGVNS